MKSRRIAAIGYLAASISLALLAGAAAAQVYECVNAKGGKEYAQYCPPGTVRQRQVVKGGDDAAAPQEAAVPAATKLNMQEAEFRKRQLERQENDAKAEQEKVKAEEAGRNCNQARSQLRTLQEGYRMSRVDPDTGERVSYGDEERAVETERAQKQVEQWCK